jgi:twitching motility protein PilT
MNTLLTHVVELAQSSTNFSDIQIEQDEPVMWKTPAGWKQTGYGIVGSDDIIPLMAAVSREWKSLLKRARAIERAINLSSARLRCSAYTTHAGTKYAMTIRRFPVVVQSIAELGLPAQVNQFASMPKGLLLVSGPTGSGKTTTIASIIRQINETREAHIITIEEPIEYVFARVKSIITQREVGDPETGADTSSFALGLKEALRQCPNVIFAGEIRDAETADTVLRAAESGHYVMATIHSRNAIGAIQKMLSFFPDDEKARAMSLSNTLCGVLAQSLAPSIDGERFIPVVEMIMNSDQSVATMIASPDKHRQLEEKLKSSALPGGTSQNDILRGLVQNKIITLKAAMSIAYAPELLT